MEPFGILFIITTILYLRVRPFLFRTTQKLLATPKSELSFGDRLRKQKVIAPIVILLYCLILKGGILDGWAGWYYAWQRMLAEILLAIRLIELERHK